MWHDHNGFKYNAEHELPDGPEEIFLLYKNEFEKLKVSFGMHKGAFVKDVPPHYRDHMLFYFLEKHNLGRSCSFKDIQDTLPQDTYTEFMKYYAHAYHEEFDQIMPFGKYKGTLINDIPEDYKQWLRRNTKNMSVLLRLQ